MARRCQGKFQRILSSTASNMIAFRTVTGNMIFNTRNVLTAELHEVPCIFWAAIWSLARAAEVKPSPVIVSMMTIEQKVQSAHYRVSKT